MDSWHRLLIAAIVVVATLALAKLVDKALSRRELAPEVATKYRTVRRVVTTSIRVCWSFIGRSSEGAATAGCRVRPALSTRLFKR